MALSIPNKIHIQTQFEHGIVHGLSCEWKNAIRLLPSDLRLQMKSPVLGIKDLKTRHACWLPKNREIIFSRNMVMHHSWDSVIEVLRHEMAHQLADEVLGAADEKAHGPVFHKACHLLRANPRASGRFPLLHQRLKRHKKNSRDKILARVQKLMALAESQNLYEAQSAAAKAHDLIKKYNVDLIQRREKRAFFSVFLGEPALRHFREAHYLANLLQDFYFVEVMWISAYVMEKAKMGRVLEISGIDRNVKIAGYVYDYINRYIDNAWQSYNKDKGLNRYRKTDFAVGIITGFHDTLKCPEKMLPSVNSQSLVNVKDQRLCDYMSYRYPHTRSVTRQTTNQDEAVLEHGFNLGKKLVISKGISTSGETGLMIGEN